MLTFNKTNAARTTDNEGSTGNSNNNAAQGRYKMMNLKRGMMILVAAQLAFGAIGTVSAQFVQAWKRGAGTSTSDKAYAMHMDAKGNIYMTGTVIVSGQGANIYTTVTSPNGFANFNVAYSGTGNSADIPADITADPNTGDVYITGSATTPTGVVMLTVRYTSGGSKVWEQSYVGGGGSGFGNAIAIDSNGDVIVTGTTGAGGTGVVVKYARNFGTQQWARTFASGVGTRNSGEAITVDSNNNVYVTGHIGTTNDGEDVVLRKYDSAGTLLWSRNFDGPYSQESGLLFGTFAEDSGKKVALDSSGNVYAAGRVTVSAVSGNDGYAVTDYILLKYNSSGTLQWSRRPGGEVQDKELMSMVLDSGNNPIITGTHGTLKYNGSGTALWSQGGNCVDVATDSANDVYTVGGTVDYDVKKYSSSGSLLQSVVYNGAQNGIDKPIGIRVDKGGAIHVGGTSYEGAILGDAIHIVKYVQPPYVQVNIEHSTWGYIGIEIGVGNPNNPLWSKMIRYQEGSFLAGQTITYAGVMDVPAFYLTPNESAVWYCKVYDYNTDEDEGTFQLFRLVTANGTFTSGNTPKTTVDSQTVNAYIPTRTNHTALVDIAHTYRGDLRVTIGVGDPNAPAWSKLVVNRTGGSLDNMWCQVDLTQALGFLPPAEDNHWFLKVEDMAAGDTGAVNLFQMISGNNLWTSGCLPAAINDMQTTKVFIPKLQGDVNCDGCVDDSDLLAVLFRFGQTGMFPEDLNGDNTVDDSDLLIVLFNFGAGC